MKHYEAALLEAFPRGATGDVFYHWNKARQAIEQAEKQEQDEPKCKTHPDAPHGFVRNASHSEDRYVCECEFWEPPEQNELAGYFKREGDVWVQYYEDYPEPSELIPLYTTPQPKQEQGEPVGKFAKFTDGIWREVTDGSAGVPLYTHPKEWVGLTDQDMNDPKTHNLDFILGARWAEEILKERSK